MRKVGLIISILFLALVGFSQNSTSAYSQGVCDCLNNQGNVDRNFIDCFEKAIQNNMSLFTQDLLSRGDTSEKGIQVLHDAILTKVSADLILTCQSFFEYMDSIGQQRYKNLNQDSLKRILNKLNSLDKKVIDKKYYEAKGNLYIRMNNYAEAQKISDTLLSKDSQNATGLLIKAMCYEKNEYYIEAAEIYDQLRNLTKNDAFLILTATARRKGLNKKSSH
jgi:tetratricopeptide (TPR) repeat protein